MKRLKNQEENTQKMWHIKAHKGGQGGVGSKQIFL